MIANFHRGTDKKNIEHVQKKEKSLMNLHCAMTKDDSQNIIYRFVMLSIIDFKMKFQFFRSPPHMHNKI